MKKNIIILLFFLYGLGISAVPAYPKPVFIQTPKGGMYINLCGDENLKYGVTTDGYIIIQEDNQWFFAKTDEDGNPSASNFYAEKAESRDESTIKFLESKAVLTKDILCIRASGSTHKINVRPKQQKSIVGSRKVLIVLAQFKDVPMSKSQADFDELFNLSGYAKDGAKGSVHDYYNYVSYNQLNLKCDVIGPFTTKYDRKFYGGNVGWDGRDQNPYSLFTEALTYASNQVSLKDYDVDGDGYIDNIHIIFAGYGEEAAGPSDAIWAHESTFEPVDMQGIKVDRYSCAAELRSNRGKGISRIGAHCHEIGHALGAMDYYDVDYNQNGNYSGTGEWDIMASGSWNEDGVSPANFNPYVKAYNFGWSEVLSIRDNGQYELSPSSSENTIIRIDTQRKGEFYLLENRQKISFDLSSPGHGLLLFHIDPGIEKYASNNKINNTYPQRCHIECANSSYKIHTSEANTYGNINSDGCPYPGTSGKTEFGKSSTPSAYCNDGTYSGVEIKNISENDKLISLSLEFSTADISDDPSTPDMPDDPGDTTIEGDVVWEEYFDSNLTGAYWQLETITGTSNWTYKKQFSLLNSNGFMQLAPTHQLSLGGNESCLARILFPLNALDPGEYIVTFETAGEIVNPNAEVNISVLHKNENTKSFEKSWTELTSNWSTRKSRIVINGDDNFLCIEGKCKAGDVLKIDALVIKKASPTNVNQLQPPILEEQQSYNVSGTPLVGKNKFGLIIIQGKKYLLRK